MVSKALGMFSSMAFGVILAMLVGCVPALCAIVVFAVSVLIGWLLAIVAIRTSNVFGALLACVLDLLSGGFFYLILTVTQMKGHVRDE